MPTTFVLIDDHPMIRHGVQTVIEAQPGWHVVMEAQDGVEGLQAIERHRPTVAIVDLSMPDLPGLEVLQLAQDRAPGVKLVVLSVHADLEHVLRAFQQGASAYVAKAAAADQLVQAVQVVLNGRRFVSRPLNPDLVWKRLDDEESASALGELTAREREVFHLTASGHSVATCAELLSISPRTVEVHRRHIFEKLDLDGQTGLMRWAQEQGLVAGVPGSSGAGD